ncbi:MAG TPA: TfuA-related McrA-glycine thioamidation protein [Methanospirillum sp.]|nr:TfuA-related McrA-glycine thioamidation protein [Methanospirillum sp.]
MPDVIIYLGPSLLPAEAEKILPADPATEYRPPVRRGDLIHAIAASPSIIGIIDGLFFESASVGHREILSALKAGIQVVGASSMGALRAAELETFGMVGVGEVFRRYRDGEIESDDEVALICDPISNAALSEALINIRITLEKAVREDILTHEESGVLFTTARSLYYPDRTYNQIIRSADIREEKRDEFRAWITTNRVDQKQSDARSALEYIRNIRNNDGDERNARIPERT